MSPTSSEVQKAPLWWAVHHRAHHRRTDRPGGEGWHNNHHRYQRAARNGFFWWEFDPTWYVVVAMSWVGLAWNLQPVPARIYDEARRGVHGAVTASLLSTSGVLGGTLPDDRTSWSIGAESSMRSP